MYLTSLWMRSMNEASSVIFFRSFSETCCQKGTHTKLHCSRHIRRDFLLLSCMQTWSEVDSDECNTECWDVFKILWWAKCGIWHVVGNMLGHCDYGINEAFIITLSNLHDLSPLSFPSPFHFYITISFILPLPSSSLISLLLPPTLPPPPSLPPFLPPFFPPPPFFLPSFCQCRQCSHVHHSKHCISCGGVFSWRYSQVHTVHVIAILQHIWWGSPSLPVWVFKSWMGCTVGDLLTRSTCVHTCIRRSYHETCESN